MIFRHIIIAVLFLFAAWSCKKDNAMDCFKSNGAETTETRYPGNFSELEVNDKIEVTIVKGSDYKVEVSAGRHVIKNIKTEVKSGVLKIENKNSCNFVRGYKRKITVTVTVPHIETVTSKCVADLIFAEGYSQDSIKVNAQSSGNVHLRGTFKFVDVESNGNGDMYLSGTTDRLKVYMRGTNYLYANDLKINDHAFIESATFGDCFVNGNGLKELEYYITTSGNIYYSGLVPSITGTLSTEAQGKLIND